jgi:hypothetical protein
MPFILSTTEEKRKRILFRRIEANFAYFVAAPLSAAGLAA